jgi:hypothetical protein
MRPGLWELGLIFVAVLIIFIATRFARSGKSRGEKGENAPGTGANKNGEESLRAKHPLLTRAGLVLIVIGVLILLLSVSVLKWVFWGSIWALILALAGLVVILVARR